MDDPNITMKEYIRLEEEKARRSIETKSSAIVFNDSLTSNETPSCEPTVSSLNDEIDFRISFDESDDEDYTVVFDKNSFSYKIFSTNDLKTDSENDNEKVNKPLFPSPEPTVSYLDDLDFFKDFENEFPAIVYNDALTSKSDFLTEPTDLEKEISTNIGEEFTNLEILNNYGVLGEVMLKGTHFGAYMKNLRKSTDLTTNTPYYSRPIRRIQDFDESKDHCLTLKNTPYPHQRYAVYNTLVNHVKETSFTLIRRIHQEDTAYPCLHFTRYHEGFKSNTPYLGTSIRCIQDLLYTKLLEDIKRGPYSKKPHYVLVEIEDDVNSLNKEGGSSATSEHVNLDAGYDSSFEDGSSKEPNVARENQGPTMEECHEKLKSMRLEPDDPVYLATTDKMLVFSEEVIRPTTFNPNPNIPGNNRRERRMFKGAVGALDGTLIHASVPSHKQNVYRARGRGDCYQNVLAICDFNMIFTYIVAGWEGTAHDARILNEALDDPIYEFPIPPSDKYYLCDAAYRHTRGFMAPYRNVSMPKFPLVKQRDITIACFAIHNFIRKEGLSDDFFAQYDQSDIHVNENVRDDNDGDVEVAQPIGSEADQQYMINLRDDIATQMMQARS
ncbi:putative nuclease HARBI1 [Tanacetum coccineum]